MIEVGMKLYYINKNTLNPEYVTVAYVDNKGFGFYYNGTAHKLPFSSLGIRLFKSSEDMWDAWNNSPLPFPERTEEAKTPPKPNEEKNFSQKTPSKSAENPKAAGRKDIIRECAECGRKFVWTVGEQKFYAEHRLSPPRTCSKECHNRRHNDYIKGEKLREVRETMQPSNPIRTGASAGKSVHVSGGNAVEISYWTMDNIEKGYTNGF